MLEDETYIVRPVVSCLSLDQVKSFLERSGTAKPSLYHEDIYVLSETAKIAEWRLRESRREGELLRSGIWLRVTSHQISIFLSCGSPLDRLPLVRFLEWLEKQCSISITENGGYPQPELYKTGVRAFLPEELRDQAQAAAAKGMYSTHADLLSHPSNTHRFAESTCGTDRPSGPITPPTDLWA